MLPHLVHITALKGELAWGPEFSEDQRAHRKPRGLETRGRVRKTNNTLLTLCLTMLRGSGPQQDGTTLKTKTETRTRWWVFKLVLIKKESLYFLCTQDIHQELGR